MVLHGHLLILFRFRSVYDNYIHRRFTAQHNCHNCKLRQNSCFTSSCSTEVLNYGHASWHAAYKAPALETQSQADIRAAMEKKCGMKRKGKKNVFIIDCIICRNKFSDKNCLFILLLFLQNACVKKSMISWFLCFIQFKITQLQFSA